MNLTIVITYQFSYMFCFTVFLRSLWSCSQPFPESCLFNLNKKTSPSKTHCVPPWALKDELAGERWVFSSCRIRCFPKQKPKIIKRKKNAVSLKEICGFVDLYFLFFDFYYQSLEVKVKENLQYVCAFSFAWVRLQSRSLIIDPTCGNFSLK